MSLRFRILLCTSALTSVMGLAAAAENSIAAAPLDAPSPAFYYNTLGQPWQVTPKGLLDWENTVGLAGVRTSPGSAGSSSALLLASLVTGLTSWADVAAVVGGSEADGEFGQAGGFFGGTGHLALDLGSDNGLALYVAPSWGFDKTGIASTALTLTAAAGHEPSDGWSRDANFAVNYTDQSSFAAVTSPDLDNLWTLSLLGAMGHAASAPLSSFSFEGYGAFCTGDIASDGGGPMETGSAWRVGGGIGYQRNFGRNPTGLMAWALYGGVQWEWADAGSAGTSSSPSLVVNFSLGTIGPRPF